MVRTIAGAGGTPAMPTPTAPGGVCHGKALTLTQPWASAIVWGYKRVETRSWRTHYRGRLAIHAAKSFPREAREFASLERGLGRFRKPYPPAKLPPGDHALGFPTGVVLCVVDLLDCIPVEEASIAVAMEEPRRWGLEHLYGDYSPGRWAWMLSIANMEVLDPPIAAKGQLGLWVYGYGL